MRFEMTLNILGFMSQLIGWILMINGLRIIPLIPFGISIGFHTSVLIKLFLFSENQDALVSNSEVCDSKLSLPGVK